MLFLFLFFLVLELLFNVQLGLKYFRYHTAVRNTGLVALSTPYIDAFGTGVLITASQTIYRGEPTNKHTPKDQVMGVLGGDFPLSYFQK